MAISAKQAQLELQEAFLKHNQAGLLKHDVENPVAAQAQRVEEALRNDDDCAGCCDEETRDVWACIACFACAAVGAGIWYGIKTII